MVDVVGVLSKTRWREPVHVELVARGIAEDVFEQPRAVGIRTIATTLAGCPSVAISGPEGVAARVFSEDGAVTFSLALGTVSVDVVIRTDEVALAEAANWTFVRSVP